MKRTWAFAWHVLLFAASALAAPFIVPYYQKVGFGGARIGLLVGLSPLITLFAMPLGTALADATGRHRLTMSLALLVGAAALFALPLTVAFASVALLVVLFTMALSPVVALATSAAMAVLGDDREAYGRIRLGGTVGYGAAAAVGGVLVEGHGLRLAFWGCAALLLLTLMVSQKLTYAPAARGPALRGGVRTLLTDPRWLLFLAMAFAGGLASIPTNSYFFPYLATLGARASVMGIVLTVGVVSEIPIFFYGDRLIRRLGPHRLLMLSLAASGARLLGFAVCGTVTAALLLQLSSGLAYPTTWLAGAVYAEEHAPAGMSATVQGLFGAMINGLGAAVGGLGGGLLLEGVGARGVFLACGLAVLAMAGIGALGGHRLGAGRRAISAGH